MNGFLNDSSAPQSGIGVGEAQVLQPIAPFNWDKIFAARRMERAKEDASRKELLKRFDKLPDQYWDKDAPEIQQQIRDFQDQNIVENTKYKGRLPDASYQDQQRKFKEIENNATLSAQQRDVFKKTFELLRAKGADYTPESIKAASIYEQPGDFVSEKIVNNKGEQTTVGDELKKYGGNKYQFRAANSHLMELDPAYHIVDRISKLSPLVPEDTTTVEQAGSLIGSHGKVQGSNTIKSIVPSRTQAEIIAQDELEKYGKKPMQELDRVFFNRMNPEQKNEYVKTSLVKAGMMGEDGNLTPVMLTHPPSERNDLIQKTVYKDAYADMIIDSKKKESSTTFTPKQKEPAGDKKKTFEDRYTVSVTPLNEILTKEKLVPDTGLGPKSTWLKTVTQTKPDTTPYVAIEPVGGKADTESLQLTVNGKQVRPIGYKVKDGKVFMKASESVPVDSKKKDFMGQPIINYTYKVTDDIPVTEEVAGNVSAHYGFKTFDAFKEMLEKEAGAAGVKPSKGKFKGNAKDYGL